MNETPYYRSLPSILSFLTGGVAGVAVGSPRPRRRDREAAPDRGGAT